MLNKQVLNATMRGGRANVELGRNEGAKAYRGCNADSAIHELSQQVV